MLTSRCKVTLMWVSGHTGIKGNEIADQLANKNLETYFIGPEPFFGYKFVMKEWIELRKKDHYENLPQDSLPKRLPNYSSKRTTHPDSNQNSNQDVNLRYVNIYGH
jgi:RNase H